MKPLQIGLLVAAGAIGGALVMKMTNSSQPAPAQVATSQAPAPAQPAADTPQPLPQVTAEPVAPEPPPSPFPEKKAKARSERPAHKSGSPAGHAAPPPAAVAQNHPPAAQPAPAPVTETPKETAPPAAAAPVEPVHVTPPLPPPPPPARVTVKAGTLLPVRLVEGLSTERNSPGDTFTVTLDQPLVVDGFVIAERGARLEGRVVTSEKAGRVKGTSLLAIELTRLNTSDGQKIAIATDSFEKHGEQSRGEDVAKVGAAAGIGAAIGAIAGGGKGAAIGAAIGGAGGTGGVMATRGKPTVLPSETRLSFRLREPVTITERRH